MKEKFWNQTKRPFGGRYDQTPPVNIDVDLPLPHCDQTILHAPGECEYCDRYSYEQALREHWRINFTGKNDPTKAPCPSLFFRSAELRDRWPGNQPTEEHYS